MNLNFITLENNQKYLILTELNINSTMYVYLVNINNKKDFVIRKQIEDELVGLDNEEELQTALLHYIDKEKEQLQNGN